MKLNIITVAVLIIGALVTLVTLFRVAGGSDDRFLAVLALPPYAVFFASCRLARTRGRALATLITSSLATAWAVVAYIKAAFIYTDHMAGLVFFLVPLYQLPIALILLAAVFFTRARHAQSAAPCAPSNRG